MIPLLRSSDVGQKRNEANIEAKKGQKPDIVGFITLPLSRHNERKTDNWAWWTRLYLWQVRLVSPAGANWLEQERKVDFPFLTKAEWAKRKTHNIRIVKIPNNIIRDRTFSPQPLNAWAFCDKLYSNIVDPLSLLLTGKEASCLRNHFLYNSGKHMNKAWLCIKSAICRLKKGMEGTFHQFSSWREQTFYPKRHYPQTHR